MGFEIDWEPGLELPAGKDGTWVRSRYGQQGPQEQVQTSVDGQVLAVCQQNRCCSWAVLGQGSCHACYPFTI